MKRIKCAFLFLLGTALISCQPPKAERPNIAWFISEDNSPFLGVYGNSYVHTPTLDSLARAGILYNNAYSNAPVCAPSRSGIITGVLPITMGSQHMRAQVTIDENIQFFTTYLKEAGYFNSLRKKRDYNIDRKDESWHEDDWWGLEEALDGRTSEQPFFMFYNTWMTHEDKLHGSQKARDYFRSTFAHLPKGDLDKLEAGLHPIDPEAITVPEYLPDIPEVREDLAKYYGLMEMMDLEFRYFIQFLKDIGELDNTIIIYSSDHGGTMARSKRFPFETGLRVPLFVWFPEKYRHLAPQSAGAVSDDMVSFLDITPSILNLAGLEIPAHMQGRVFMGKNPQKAPEYAFGFRDRMDEAYDLVRTIKGPQFRYTKNFMPYRPSGQPITFLWKAPHVAAWEAHYQQGMCDENTARFWESRAPEELYDTKNDPFEIHNLASDPAHQQTLETMRADLLSYLKSVHDLGCIPEGLLYEKQQQEGLRYDQQYDKETVKELIQLAFEVTLSPDPERIQQLLKHDDPVFQYWGLMGMLIMEDPAPLKPSALEMSGTVRGDLKVVLAEVLFQLGEKSLALTLFRETLQENNPYVLLRALNTIENLKDPVQDLKVEIMALSEDDFPDQPGYAFRIQERLVKHFQTPAK